MIDFDSVEDALDRSPWCWLESRKELGRQIDPATAKVSWWFVQVADPYGVDPELPEELQCIGRDYFAAAPGSNVWIWFGDLPEATSRTLWERIKRGDFEGEDDWLWED